MSNHNKAVNYIVILSKAQYKIIIDILDRTGNCVGGHTHCTINARRYKRFTASIFMFMHNTTLKKE